MTKPRSDYLDKSDVDKLVRELASSGAVDTELRRRQSAREKFEKRYNPEDKVKCKCGHYRVYHANNAGECRYCNGHCREFRDRPAPDATIQNAPAFCRCGHSIKQHSPACGSCRCKSFKVAKLKNAREIKELQDIAEKVSETTPMLSAELPMCTCGHGAQYHFAHSNQRCKYHSCSCLMYNPSEA